MKEKELPPDSEAQNQLIAAIILAGLCSNPHVIAHNPQCGWSLVNTDEESICKYALGLADWLRKLKE
jgi:hypothetical protein